MEKSIQGYLCSLQLGEIQQFKNLTMVPVVSDYDDGLGYLTLGEALGAGSIEIREVSEGGSVPELRVVMRTWNRGRTWLRCATGANLLSMAPPGLIISFTCRMSVSSLPSASHVMRRRENG
jgi:hypothetical protein